MINTIIKKIFKRHISCLLGKHELDVECFNLRGQRYPRDGQVVKCNKCEHTIKIENNEVYVLIK